MQRILNDIYTVEGLRMGRVYVIKNPDGLTLIDTSLPGSLPQIEKELQRIGHQLGEIKRILITHAHPDHFGSLAALKAATGAQSYAHHRYESAVIRGEKPILRPDPSRLHGISKLLAGRIKLPDAEPTQVDYELKEGDRLDDVLPGLEVVDTPGHSPGHCSFWQPEQRLLFCGDALAHMPFGLSQPPALFTSDMDEAKRSIHKIAALNADILCMGHGKPYPHGAAAIIKAFSDKIARKQ